MKRHLARLLIIILLVFTSINISYAMTGEPVYLAIKLTKPLIDNKSINLQSDGGFQLLYKDGMESFFKIDQPSLRLILDDSSNLYLVDPLNNKVFTLPADGSVLISGSDLKTSLIRVEKDRYRDYLDFRTSNGKIIVLNYVELENYLYGVVPREMGYNFPSEALKAQAVASRSFALSNSKHKAEGYNLCDTTDCQVYLGYDSEHEKTNYLVDETRGLLALYDRKPIQAIYHSSSSGRTESSANLWGGELPYLKSVEDEFSLGSPNANWEYSISEGEFNNKLLSSGLNVGNFLGIEIHELTNTGHVSKLRLIGSSKEEIISASKLRSLLGNSNLKSLSFQVKGSGGMGQEQMVYVLAGGDSSPRSLDLKDLYIIDSKKQSLPSRSSSRRLVSRDRHKDLSLTSPVTGSNLVFSGSGYGHGVGMSQFGAKKMAELGYSFVDILNHYYTDIEINKI